jgi:Uma2 family endonuclease
MSTEAVSTPRKLEPGTSGWTASDLDDPAIAAQWDAGHFEIVNGILTKMPPADFAHGEAVFELLSQVREHLRATGTTARVSTEVDLIVDEDDVLRVDGMLVTDREVAEQKKVLIEMHRDSGRLGRIRVAPLLVIESVSAAHERHDRLTKRRLYAGFGIPHYWIVDTIRRTLECLILDKQEYRTEVIGRANDVVSPAAFPGFQIHCDSPWGE